VRRVSIEQLIFLAIFVMLPLAQVLFRWVQRRLREAGRPADGGAGGGAEPVVPARPGTTRELPRAAAAPVRPPVSPAALPAAAPAAPARRGRFRGPLGGRRDLRRAIVLMTILGECRGAAPPPERAG
jgi:hypothetical protein